MSLLVKEDSIRLYIAGPLDFTMRLERDGAKILRIWSSIYLKAAGIFWNPVHDRHTKGPPLRGLRFAAVRLAQPIHADMLKQQVRAF